MKTQLIQLIVQRLNEAKEQLKTQFFLQHPIKVARHFALDNFFPDDLAHKIYSEFPKPRKMRVLRSYGELKSRYLEVKHVSPLLQDLYHAIQDPQVIAVLEDITKIKNQVADQSRPAGGISSLLEGYFINPHLDFSHNAGKTLYRTLNLLYYVSPNWQVENGGNFEVWDEAVENRIVIPNLFNRLVVMETNRKSWHSVNPVLCEEPRCCVFNYYFSEQSPEGEDYFHGSTFSLFNPLFKARPEQKIRRAIDRVKNNLLKKLSASR